MELPGTPLAPFGWLIQSTSPGADISDLSLSHLRQAVHRHRVVVLREFRALSSKESLASYSATWGPLLEWDFGTVFEVVEHENPKNYLFTSGSVPFHWDGAFARTVPWLQVFQCVESPGLNQGGETTFSDTARVWMAAAPELQARWKLVEIDYFSDKVAHYGGRVRAPLVARHPHTGETVLRFAEPADTATARLNTPELKVHGIPDGEVPGFLEDLRRRLYEPANLYAHSWHAGDQLIADNHVLLHGRRPYRSKLPRRLWRVHVL